MSWENELRERLGAFTNKLGYNNGIAVSLKFRVVSGCFQRECSSNAFKLIDMKYDKFKSNNVNII